MRASITADMIQKTVEKPHKLIDCENLELTFYIRKFDGLGELLVVAKKEEENLYDIKCFNWMSSMGFRL